MEASSNERSLLSAVSHNPRLKNPQVLRCSERMQTLQVGSTSSETQFLHYCYICNTQLNSCKQALLHCSGKRHRKKLNFLQTRKGNHGSASAAQTGFYHGDSVQPTNNNSVDQKQPNCGALVPLQQAHLYPPATPPVQPPSQVYSSLPASNVCSQIEPNPSSFNHQNPSPLAGMIRTPNALYEGTTLQGGLHYPIVGGCNYPPLHTQPDSNGWYTYSTDLPMGFPVTGHPPSIPTIAPGPVPARSSANSGILPAPKQKAHAYSQPPPGPLLNSPSSNPFIAYQQGNYKPSEHPVNCNNNPPYIYHNGYSCYSNSSSIANSESGGYASIPDDSTKFQPSLQPNSQIKHSWLIAPPPPVNVPPINNGAAPPRVQTDMSMYASTTPLSSSYSGGTGSRSNIVSPSETSSISSDSLASGARTTYSCLVCGQQYLTLSLLHNHLQSARHYRTGHSPANMIQENNLLKNSTKKPSENPSSLETKLKTPAMLSTGDRSGALIHYCSVCHIAADTAPSGAKETETSNGVQLETSPSSSSIGDSHACTPPLDIDPGKPRAISRSSSTSSEMVEPTRDSGYVSGSCTGIPVEPCACHPDVVDEGLPAIRFHCQLCNIFLNSPAQAKQHISSQKHQVRASGKLQTFRRKFGSYRKRLLSSQLTASTTPASPGEVGGDACPTTTDESSDSPTSDDATVRKAVNSIKAQSVECYACMSGDEDSEVEGLGSVLRDLDSSGDDHEGYDYVITLLPESTQTTSIQLDESNASESGCLTDQITYSNKLASLGLRDGESCDRNEGEALCDSGVGILYNHLANDDGSIGLNDFCDNFPPLGTTSNDNR